MPEPDTTPVLSTCDLKALAVVFAWAVEGVDPYPSLETWVTCDDGANGRPRRSR